MGKNDKMDADKKFSLTERLKSISNALHGVLLLLRYEHNARIHLVILISVVIAGMLLRLTGAEWMAILFVAGLVFVSECFNTAIEYLSDQITSEKKENIRRAKDVAAAGVLISAVISVVTGLIIFLPEIIRLIRRLTI
jgi:diacylglycerol kinase